MDRTQHANRATALAARYASSAEILNLFADLVSNRTNPAAKPELSAAIIQLSDAEQQPKVTEPFPNYCPCCGSAPGVAVLRPEADGSRRYLICAHCAYEWPYQRILCPSCQEQRFEELPVYIAEEFPHLRVESCSTCKHYLISADLSKDAEAIPLVEDIAALSLHLWAADHGYTKIELNLFGF